MSGNDPTGTPEVRDKRLTPPGVLPKNTQAWVLAGLAVVMVAVIALSGHNAPKEKRITAQVPATDPNAAQIQGYENQLREETQRLQLAKDQLARTQQALGVVPSAGYARPNGMRLMSAESSADESVVQIDRTKREQQSLFASNIALTYRKDAAPAQTPASVSPADLVAKALASYIPATSVAPPGTIPGVAESSPAAASAHLETRSAKARAAERDAELAQAEGKEYRLFEGTVLETVLTNRLDGSFSGPVNCMVTANVYSHNGQHVLIPQGTRVLGDARKVETFGERRLAVAFHRLIMPDGYSLSLDKFQGLNQIGETGLEDLVNHHYLQVFGVSIAIGLVAGFSQANTSYGAAESATDAYRQGMASSLSQSSTHILDRYLNVVPTITIREGHRVKVYLSDDLLLPAYEKHQMPGDL
jgi:type IV secretion system protein VirB10